MVKGGVRSPGFPDANFTPLDDVKIQSIVTTFTPAGRRCHGISCRLPKMAQMFQLESHKAGLKANQTA